MTFGAKKFAERNQISIWISALVRFFRAVAPRRQSYRFGDRCRAAQEGCAACERSALCPAHYVDAIRIVLGLPSLTVTRCDKDKVGDVNYGADRPAYYDIRHVGVEVRVSPPSDDWREDMLRESMDPYRARSSRWQLR